MSTICWNRNISDEAHQKMKEFTSSGDDIVWFASPPPGGNHWSIITNKTFLNRNIPDECHQKMKELHDAGQTLRLVAFPGQGGNKWSVIGEHAFFDRNVPDECHMILGELYACHGPIRCVAFDGDGNGWSVVSGAKPAVVYRLPFDNDPAWNLSNGNWDDPLHGHNQGNPTGLQAFAFDFVHPEGGHVRAARGGTVYALVASESGNSWGSKDPCKPGVGNYLVIDHGDGTFGVYWHMKQNGILVKVGNKVNRGDAIALSGNTGNSSTPHLHFDVRTGWDLKYSCSNLSEFPSLRIRFEDKNHICWIPRVGDMLASNNS